MDIHELKKLGEELAEALDLEGKPLFELKIQIGRLLSHLESEQRVTLRHEKELMQHDKALFGDKEDLEKHPGVVNTLSDITRNQRRNQKMLGTVLTGILSLVAIEVLKLVFHAVK